MCGFCQELEIFFFDCFQFSRDSYINREFLNSFDCCFSVFILRHFIYSFDTHCSGDLTIFLTCAFLIVFHNDRKHHCAGNTVWCVINSTKCMSHGMSDSKTYVRESHTSDILSKSHSFTTFFCVFNSTAERFGDQLDCF